jgi:ferredoxin-NADP reductase
MNYTFLHEEAVDLTVELKEVETRVRVARRERIAEDVVQLTVTAADGHALPAWNPGAHIDLLLPNGLTRQYSLCGDRNDRFSYTVGVLREAESRGGSVHLHDEVATDDLLTVRGPRNHFRLGEAASYLFIAGGIGITPIFAMIQEVNARGADWRLVYAGRRRTSMAFVPQLAAFGDRVTFWPREESPGRLDLSSVLATPGDGTSIYCCGPERLLAAVEQNCSELWPAGALHVERFSAKPADPTAVNTSFEVELRKSGLKLTVPADKSVMATVEEAGINVLSSCGEGTCGTCETEVIEGEPDHRDSVLTPEEKAENSCMMICISRSKCPLLVLDL